MSLSPGATIGILGAGQLGRMLAIAALKVGLRTHVFAPEPRRRLTTRPRREPSRPSKTRTRWRGSPKPST